MSLGQINLSRLGDSENTAKNIGFFNLSFLSHLSLGRPPRRKNWKKVRPGSTVKDNRTIIVIYVFYIGFLQGFLNFNLSQASADKLGQIKYCPCHGEHA